MSNDPFVEDTWAFALAGFFSFLGIFGSLYNILLHLLHFNEPKFQIWIIRVLFIVPLYALISWISIKFQSPSLYLEIIRDCYEAFVIYCFLIWILNAFGGEESCSLSIAKSMYMKHPWPLCCLQIRLNRAFLKVCKQLTLQFVILKPIFGVIDFVLLSIGGEHMYNNVIWQSIMLTLYNLSYTFALYGLLLFYMATKNEMSSYSPVSKFFAVKSVVFMTYWQSLFVPLVFPKSSDKYNDFILCFEMTIFAWLHYKAFPWWEFKYSNITFNSNPSKELQTQEIYNKHTLTWNNEIDYDENKDNKENETIDDTMVDKDPSISHEHSKSKSKSFGIVGFDDIELNNSLLIEEENELKINKSNVTICCESFYQVINIRDIFNDAYRVFRPIPKNIIMSSGSKKKNSKKKNVKLQDNMYHNFDSNSSIKEISDESESKSEESMMNVLVNRSKNMDLRTSDLSYESAKSDKENIIVKKSNNE